MSVQPFDPDKPLAEDPLVEAFDRGHQEGYDAGYSIGYDDGAEDAYRSVASEAAEEGAPIDIGRLIETLERMRGGE